MNRISNTNQIPSFISNYNQMNKESNIDKNINNSSSKSTSTVNTLFSEEATSTKRGIDSSNAKLALFVDKKGFQEAAKRSFERKDWNGLWWTLKGASLGARTGGPFAKYPVAGYMLDRFLSNTGGTVNLDYTFAFPGQSNWISKSPSTVAKVAQLDEMAVREVKRLVANGQTSGVVKIPGSVVTDGEKDGDLYYALGKFSLDGEYKFSARPGFRGNKEKLIIERVYNFSDRYDWDPRLKGGILPHAYPYALQQQGMASEFDVKGRFGEPQFQIDLK